MLCFPSDVHLPIANNDVRASIASSAMCPSTSLLDPMIHGISFVLIFAASLISAQEMGSLDGFHPRGGANFSLIRYQDGSSSEFSFMSSMHIENKLSTLLLSKLIDDVPKWKGAVWNGSMDVEVSFISIGDTTITKYRYFVSEVGNSNAIRYSSNVYFSDAYRYPSPVDDYDNYVLLFTEISTKIHSDVNRFYSE